jgi:putative colanic acid biosynthesis glycosyltransferase
MAQNNIVHSSPLFSIITVTFNDHDGLSQTHESIKLQIFKDYEWVIIDGASTDGTTSYLKSLVSSQIKWISEKDFGIYDAMNKGIMESSGKYIVFMNAGDVFSDANVLRIVSTVILSTTRTIDVIFGGATLKFPNGVTSFRAARNLGLYIRNGLPAIHQATYYRRERLLSCTYDLKYRICGDYYIISMLYVQGISTEYLHCSLVDFRIGDTSYRNPITVLIEGYRIQRDVLNCPFHFRIISLARRAINIAAWMVLSQPLTARSAGYVANNSSRNDVHP